MTFIPIGIDIAKAKFDAAALRNGKYQTKVFQNTPEGFINQARKYPPGIYGPPPKPVRARPGLTRLSPRRGIPAPD